MFTEDRNTVNKPNKPNTSYVILIAGAAALGGFLFGFDTAVINGAVTALQRTFNISSAMTGFAVSSALLGSALGAFMAGPIADRLGRTKSMIIASVMFTLSAIGSGIPFGIWDFMFWRALGGVAVGIASVIAPAYIAEVAPAHLRGRLGSLQQLAIVVGIFMALLCNYFIALGAGGVSRRVVLVWSHGLALDVLVGNSASRTLRNSGFCDSGIASVFGCSGATPRSG
jgi:SP family sugar:H+ symporter-like MFS transporter